MCIRWYDILLGLQLQSHYGIPTWMLELNKATGHQRSIPKFLRFCIFGMQVRSINRSGARLACMLASSSASCKTIHISTRLPTYNVNVAKNLNVAFSTHQTTFLLVTISAFTLNTFSSALLPGMQKPLALTSPYHSRRPQLTKSALLQIQQISYENEQ
jgi:hypothetical protein